MKKILIFCFMFFGIYTTLNAECTYKDQRELITLASYVTSDYSYNERNQTFSITFDNMTDRMSVSYNSIINPQDGKVIIDNLKEGTSVKVNIKSSEKDICSNYNLRVMNINLPYLNPYYNREECTYRKTLQVCNSKFLDYKISEEQFKNLVSQTKEEKSDFGEDEEENKEELSFFQRLKEIIIPLLIPTGLVIISSLITYLIFSTIYRRIKHGL